MKRDKDKLKLYRAVTDAKKSIEIKRKRVRDWYMRNKKYVLDKKRKDRMRKKEFYEKEQDD